MLDSRKPLVTVTEHDTVERALELMLANDYSQLPIVSSDGKPLGMVTYESILAPMRLGAPLETVEVHDVAEPLRQLFRKEHDLFQLLEVLRNAPAVLVVDETDKLAAIVTSYDTSLFFLGRTEGTLLVADIEII